MFLSINSGDYNAAAVTMLEHRETWQQQNFIDVIIKVDNVELYYAAIQFYLDHKPMLLNEMLIALSPHLDLSRALSLFTEGFLPVCSPLQFDECFDIFFSSAFGLGKKFLLHEQRRNNKELN